MYSIRHNNTYFAHPNPQAVLDLHRSLTQDFPSCNHFGAEIINNTTYLIAHNQTTLYRIKTESLAHTAAARALLALTAPPLPHNSLALDPMVPALTLQHFFQSANKSLEKIGNRPPSQNQTLVRIGTRTVLKKLARSSNSDAE